MLVLGAGPAGLKAAVELARAGFKTEIVTKGSPSKPEWVVPSETLKLLPDKGVVLEKYKEGTLKHLRYGTEVPIKGKFLLLNREEVLENLREEARVEGVTFVKKPQYSTNVVIATGSKARKFEKSFYCYGLWVDKLLVEIPTVEINSVKYGFFLYPYEKRTFVSVWHTRPMKDYLEKLKKRTGVKHMKELQCGVVPVEMKVPSEDGKIFVGDALSAATPVMGEGFRPALISAITAAKAISKGEDYEKLLNEKFGFAYKFSAFLRDRIWDLPPQKINQIMSKLKTCNQKTVENLVKTKTTVKDGLSIFLKCFGLFFFQ